MVCLTHEDIVEVVEGLADRARLAEVEAHLACCSSCRALVALGGASDSVDSCCQPTLPSPNSAQLVVGQKIDQYLVEQLIGAGSMGEVYLARDTVLKRPVALKLIRVEALDSARGYQRFLFEARATARCHHPNIVTIYGVGEHQGRPYLALEYVVGQSLRQRLSIGCLTRDEVVHVILSIAHALRAAHSEGILHRDLKPENVMRAEQNHEVRVLDFGLAKSFDARASSAGGCVSSLAFQTEGRGLRGTPAYMAPEQWDGKPATPAADVWALGVMIVELYRGAPPFGNNLLELVRGVFKLESELPSLLEGLPATLASLARRCLQQDPASRPTVDQVIEALESCTGAQPARSRIWLAAALASSLLALSAGWYVATQRDPAAATSAAEAPAIRPRVVRATKPTPVDAGVGPTSSALARAPASEVTKTSAPAPRNRGKRAKRIRKNNRKNIPTASDAGVSPTTPTPRARPRRPRRRWVGEGLMEL